MLIFSMAVVSPFVISFFLKDLYHCWSLQPPLFFISLYTLYTALPEPAGRFCRSESQRRGGWGGQPDGGDVRATSGAEPGEAFPIAEGRQLPAPGNQAGLDSQAGQ